MFGSGEQEASGGKVIEVSDPLRSTEHVLQGRRGRRLGFSQRPRRELVHEAARIRLCRESIDVDEREIG